MIDEEEPTSSSAFSAQVLQTPGFTTCGVSDLHLKGRSHSPGAQTACTGSKNWHSSVETSLETLGSPAGHRGAQMTNSEVQQCSLSLPGYRCTQLPAETCLWQLGQPPLPGCQTQPWAGLKWAPEQAGEGPRGAGQGHWAQQRSHPRVRQLGEVVLLPGYFCKVSPQRVLCPGALWAGKGGCPTRCAGRRCHLLGHPGPPGCLLTCAGDGRGAGRAGGAGGVGSTAGWTGAWCCWPAPASVSLCSCIARRITVIFSIGMW